MDGPEPVVLDLALGGVEVIPFGTMLGADFGADGSQGGLSWRI